MVVFDVFRIKLLSKKLSSIALQRRRFSSKCLGFRFPGSLPRINEDDAVVWRTRLVTRESEAEGARSSEDTETKGGIGRYETTPGPPRSEGSHRRRGVVVTKGLRKVC